MIDELIGSKLKNEERADERCDTVRDDFTVDHVVVKL